MRKSAIKKVLAWLLVAMQLLTSTALADTIIQGASTFSVSEFVGNFTVRFLDTDGTEIYTETEVDYETPMTVLFDSLLAAHTEYADTLWSVTRDYLVLNNVDVFKRGEAVARVGSTPFATLQEAIDADETVDGSTILLLADIEENIDTKGKSFTLDMGGHTLSAPVVGRAYKQEGGTVTVLQGTITGGDIEDNGAGMYVKDGTLTARYVTLCDNITYKRGGGLYAEKATVELDNCTIAENRALLSTKNDGAGIAVSGGTLTARNTSISRNSMSKGRGAGIYVNGKVILENCEVSHNSSGYHDAYTVYVDSNGKLEATGLTIADNTNEVNSSSAEGGALKVEGQAYLGAGCRIENNTGYFGGVFVDIGAVLETGDGLVVQGNTGVETGGLYAGTYSTISFGKNVQFVNNIATGADGAGGLKAKPSLELINAKFTGNTANGSNGSGGVMAFGSLTLTGVEFSGNKAAGPGTTVGGVMALGSGCKLSNCTFEQNEGATGALDIATTGKALINGCKFCYNKGTAYAGAIYDRQPKFYCTYVYGGSTVIGNTGYKTGGIYIGKQTKCTTEDNKYDKSIQIYGNTATDGNRGNDITVASGAYAAVIPANAMGNGSPIYKGFTWGGGTNTDTLAVGEYIVGQSYPAKSELHYTARSLVPVAQNITKADQPQYFTLQEAIDEAATGETIKLIAVDGTGVAETVSESASITGKALTLLLNDHELNGISGAALTIAQGAQLTLEGSGRVSGAGECYAVVNQGEVILNTDAEINGIDHQGSLLQANCTVNVTKIALEKGKAMTGGSQLKAGDDGPLSFVIGSKDLEQLNEGWLSVTLVIPMPGECLEDDLLTTTAIDGMRETVLIQKKKGRVIARISNILGVFVDGQSGNDANNDGLTSDEPVKSFERAKKILNGLMGDGSPLSPENKASLAGIYVMNQIDVTDTQTWELDGKTMLRYPNYTGYLAAVSGNLTLRFIVMDGGRQGAEASKALVKVEGTLNIEQGAALQNNNHTVQSGSYVEAGGAVYCDGGTVVMNGGQITGNTSWYGGGICMWNGKLEMRSGSINGNSAEALAGNTPIGGGVALLCNAVMTMEKGGKVSGNHSGGYGGGIGVGGVVSNTVGNAKLTMNGGEVSNNVSEEEGGGIFIQSDATGNITGGEIKNNHSKDGAFGGGGIYVNGTRAVGNTTFGAGKLYLKNVIVTKNSAGIDGGGLAGCSTSDTRIYVGNGGAIYGNQCDNSPEIYIDYETVGGYAGEPSGSISGYMLGGAPYDWFYTRSNHPALPDDLSNIAGTLRLDNSHTDESAKGACALAKVWITGNTAANRGGGIGSNGFVQIGTAPTEGEWTPAAIKTLTGRDMAKDEFSFTVTDENGKVVSTGTSLASADGAAAEIVFDSISLDGEAIGAARTYVITEAVKNVAGVSCDKTMYTVTITVIAGLDPEDNATSRLTGYVSSIGSSAQTDETDAIAFVNQYKPTKTEAQLKVSKAVIGQTPSMEHFTFTLAIEEEQKDAAYVEMPSVTEVTVTGAGNAEFDPITFGKAGEYVFVIRETAGQEKGYEYDPSEWEACVKVVDENAVLRVESIKYSKRNSTESNGTAAAFENTYSPASTTLSIPVNKMIENASPLSRKTFAFTLTAKDNAPMPKDAKDGVSTLKISGAGEDSFGAISYTKAGTYAYVVKETAGSDAGYTYDTTEYNVTVSVTDRGGYLNASWSVDGKEMDALNFTNQYRPNSATLDLPIRKEITGSERPEEKTFTFLLRAVTENAPMPKKDTVTIPGEGDAVFGIIRYAEAGEWTYTVNEVADSKEGYTYDTRVYTVTVTVTDEDGNLRTAWTTDRGDVERLTFVNDYAPEPTPTVAATEAPSPTLTVPATETSAPTPMVTATEEPTDTPVPAFTTIRVRKQWEDFDNYDQIRPASVTVNLQRRVGDGTYETVETIEMTGEGNTWTYTFRNLPTMNKRGALYQYRVREAEVEGYTAAYNGYTITNIHAAVTPEPEATPLPTPEFVGLMPERAVGMKYVDGEWIWIDEYGVPLGVVAQTGDQDSLTILLIGMGVLLVLVAVMVYTIVRRGKKKKS